LRTKDRIQRAHDLLGQVAVGEFPEIALDDETKREVEIAKDTLCWVLGHDSNFWHNLGRLKESVEASGHVLQPQGWHR